jgi:hypothetical protein
LIVADLRQKFHLTPCAEFPIHLSAIADSLLERTAFAPPVLREYFRCCNSWLRGGDWMALARAGDVRICLLTEIGTNLVIPIVRDDGSWLLGEAKLQNNRIPPARPAREAARSPQRAGRSDRHQR